MDPYPPSTSPDAMAPDNSTYPYGNQAEKDAIQARRDMSIVLALLLVAIPLFVGSLRYISSLQYYRVDGILTHPKRVFHPRRIKKYATHDYLLFIAMVRGDAGCDQCELYLRRIHC
jgi:hypothetical protein